MVVTIKQNAAPPASKLSLGEIPVGGAMFIDDVEKHVALRSAASRYMKKHPGVKLTVRKITEGKKTKIGIYRTK